MKAIKIPSFFIIVSLVICACNNPLMDSLLQTKTIFFDSNGGSFVPPQTLFKNEKISEPRAPVKTGYFFVGWFTYLDDYYMGHDDNYYDYYRWDFNIIPEGDMTLYAAWSEKPTPTEKDFIINGTDYVEYDGNPKIVIITAYPEKTGGKITVYYEGTEDTEYARAQAAPTSPGTYKVTFDVAASEGWNAANNLFAGILIINMSVMINQTPVASDFNIGGALTFSYDGSSKTVNVEPKKGKSQGTVTIYYNGNTSPPVNIGTYTVTFDVAPADGWYAAYGLAAGTLTIIAVNPNHQTPAAGDYSIEGNGTFIYDGSARAVTVMPNTGKSQGTIIIKYNGRTTAPINAGTYTVTFDVAVANGWNSASGLSAGTITISKATPSPHDFNINGTGTTYYDGNAKAVTISPKTDKSQGTVTVHYEKETDRTMSETPPSAVGTYIVTFDVEESENWNAINESYAGFLTINKGTPTVNDFNVSGLTQIYNGSAKTVNITPKINNILAVNNIYYGNSTTAPVNAGNYNITFDVAEDTTGNWNPVDRISAGTLTVNRATPVKEDYDISNNLIQNEPYPNNNISAVTVTVKTDSTRSPGAVIVYYEGTNGTAYTKSTAKPSNIGSYTVTFNVAESETNQNWNAVNGLIAGTLKINVFETINALGTWLKEQSENNITNPYPVALNVSDLGGNSNTPGSAGAMFKANNTKYVSLDLYGSKFISIGDSAFNECKNLTSVIIPDSVTIIGEGAFHSCKFTSVTIGNGVTGIGKEAFMGCTGLKSIIIPDKVTSIGNSAFEECDGINSVTFNKDNITIGDNAFVGGNDLRSKYSTGKAGTYIKSSNDIWAKL
jgi:hypothetical protein